MSKFKPGTVLLAEIIKRIGSIPVAATVLGYFRHVYFQFLSCMKP